MQWYRVDRYIIGYITFEISYRSLGFTNGRNANQNKIKINVSDIILLCQAIISVNRFYLNTSILIELNKNP